MRNLLISLCLSLCLARCGGSGTGEEPIRPGSSVKMLVFSAPWCDTCKPKIKKLETLLTAQLQANRSRVAVTLFVQEGKNNNDPPSEEVTQTYKNSLGTEFPTKSDDWRWKTYRNYYGKDLRVLPAVVLLKENNEILQAFDPNNFTVEDVVDTLKGVLN